MQRASSETGTAVLLFQEPRLSCHSEISISSSEGEMEGERRGGEMEGGRGGEEAGGGRRERDGDSPFSNGDVLTNGDEMDMEVDGDEGVRREEEEGEEEEEEGRRKGREGVQSSSEEPLDLDHNPVAIERILAFGRELQSLHTKLSGGSPSEQTKRLLQVSSPSIHSGLSSLSMTTFLELSCLPQPLSTVSLFIY